VTEHNLLMYMMSSPLRTVHKTMFSGLTDHREDTVWFKCLFGVPKLTDVS